MPYKNHSYFLIYYILIKKSLTIIIIIPIIIPIILTSQLRVSEVYSAMMQNARSGAVQFARLEAENSRRSARLSIAPRAPINIPSRGSDLKRSGKQEIRHPEESLGSRV